MGSINTKILAGFALAAVVLAGYLLISKTRGPKEPPLLEFSVGNSIFGSTTYVTITQDGRVEYRRVVNLTDEVEKFTRKLTPAQMENLVSFIRREKLLEQPNAMNAALADAGSYQVSINIDGKQHRISCNRTYQCQGVYRLHLLLNQLLGSNTG